MYRAPGTQGPKCPSCKEELFGVVAPGSGESNGKAEKKMETGVVQDVGLVSEPSKSLSC